MINSFLILYPLSQFFLILTCLVTIYSLYLFFSFLGNIEVENEEDKKIKINKKILENIHGEIRNYNENEKLDNRINKILENFKK